jgi:hypothetical protein
MSLPSQRFMSALQLSNDIHTMHATGMVNGKNELY